ncbi:MAG: EF-hand domain-containing protein [Alphaproteobacteria bacterium]
MKKSTVLLLIASLWVGMIAEVRAFEPPFPPEDMFKEMDVNGDGQLTKEEVINFHSKIFTQMDKNKDGIVTREEAKSLHQQKLKEKICHD